MRFGARALFSRVRCDVGIFAGQDGCRVIQPVARRPPGHHAPRSSSIDVPTLGIVLQLEVATGWRFPPPVVDDPSTMNRLCGTTEHPAERLCDPQVRRMGFAPFSGLLPNAADGITLRLAPTSRLPWLCRGALGLVAAPPGLFRMSQDRCAVALLGPDFGPGLRPGLTRLRTYRLPTLSQTHRSAGSTRCRSGADCTWSARLKQERHRERGSSVASAQRGTSFVEQSETTG